MKTAFNIAVLAVLLITPNRSFALWFITPVSNEEAKKLGMEVRSEVVGPNHVRVDLEFKIEGTFKDFSSVDLRIGEGDSAFPELQKYPPVTAPLREDRSKPGRVIVRFITDRGQLEKIKLWVMVPELDGGSIYDLRVKDFVGGKQRKTKGSGVVIGY
jgi:hypothetical protein